MHSVLTEKIEDEESDGIRRGRGRNRRIKEETLH